MTTFTGDDLYRRGALTLLAAWEEHARGAAGASLRRLPGAGVAERVYARVGFRDLGRFLEYGPPDQGRR